MITDFIVLSIACTNSPYNKKNIFSFSCKTSCSPCVKQKFQVWGVSFLFHIGKLPSKEKNIFTLLHDILFTLHYAKFQVWGFFIFITYAQTSPKIKKYFHPLVWHLVHLVSCKNFDFGGMS